ncbi:signal peptidase I [Candidatus Enterococcus ikei]|uniref:Signal peptidase I n=1 Tax=Candidatus Enterococcus ikei TaxID=2815326 RepID=A0ABS3GXD5_9ENTE|nr:signal peptidase I [Enterococcus sp. DIV0869a]MBO0439870.1 signal peptidase I [Enterococcus sp. DIV0869a]
MSLIKGKKSSNRTKKKRKQLTKKKISPPRSQKPQPEAKKRFKRSKVPQTHLKPPKKKNTQKKKKLKRKKIKKKRLRRLLIELALTIFVTSGILYLVSVPTFTIAKFEGYSMDPTVNEGDTVYVNKLAQIRRYRLVYFNVPNNKEKSVRRVIGLPGEEVFYKNDKLFVNNKEKIETYLAKSLYDAKQTGIVLTDDFNVRHLTGQSTIPKGKYLVLGDNRKYSSDSRYYGLIDEKDIIGVVQMRLMPFHKMMRY